MQIGGNDLSFDRQISRSKSHQDTSQCNLVVGTTANETEVVLI